MSRFEGVALHFDAFHLPPAVDLLYRGDEVIPLEPRAVRVLRYLAENPDRVLSKEELLEEVWSDVFTTDGVLKKAVSQIRRVLGDDAEQARFIVTYHGRGYRFIAAVTSQSTVVATPGPVVPSYDQLAGRDAELATLRAELRSALEGAPRPVVILGESGIGKTQLVRHFRRTATEDGAVSLYGRFFDYRGARLAPYELFVDLLRSAAGIKEDDERPLRDALAAACGVRLPAELFGDVEHHGAAVGTGNVGDHFRVVVPICRAWLTLSRRQPMVIIFDDVQWADAASLDALGCLMRMLDGQRLMLVMVARSDEADRAGHPLRAWLEEHAAGRTYTTLRLERLDETGCRAVIGAIFGIRRTTEIPRADVETLFRLTDGNPYFLVETLRMLVGAEAIVPELSTRRWVWRGMEDCALPETIVTAARAKIASLAGDVHALIEQAAVIGDEFHIATLCRLTAQDEPAVEALLSEAVRGGVLSTHGLTPGEDCRFQHSILRHVVYDAIPPSRRRVLHARVAAAVESVYGESDRVAEALAAHYAAAGDARLSFAAGMRAWRAARSRSEWRKAVKVLQRAEEAARTIEETEERLSCAERLALLLAQGQTWHAVGRGHESAEALERAVSLASSAGDDASLAHALFLRGLTSIALSRYVEARASLAQALDLFLQADNSMAVSRTLVELAVVEAAIGNYDRSSLLVAEIRAAGPSEELTALADGIVGWSLALHGRYAEGAWLLERARAYHDRTGAVRERAMLLRRLHWTYLSRGSFETAIRLAVRAREDSVTVGDVDGEAMANMGIGQARLAQGLHEEAVSYLTRALEQLQSSGDAHCQAECFWLLGRARCETGATDESSVLLERALSMVRTIGDRDDEFRILIDLARLRLVRGELAAAQEHALAARVIAEKLDNREGSALAALELANLELARGNAGPAAEIARHAGMVLESLQSSERLRAWSIRALVEQAAGDTSEARASLGRAVVYLDELRDQVDPDDTARRLQITRSRSQAVQKLTSALAHSGA
jgi:DNA-binding winged helix-turn-helix (wHTH) protein/tetratricopeptide (TPR) repeat protein